MAEPIFEDELFEERVNFFREFLDNDYGQGEYKTAIKRMLNNNEQRLVVSIDHLREYNREYAENLIQSPYEYLPAFERALKKIVVDVVNTESAISLKEDVVYHIGLRGSFGDHHLNPRTLRASYLGKLISLEGIVTHCSLVRPKVAKSVHYCEKTGRFHQREYKDATTLGGGMPTSSVYPMEDDNGNPLTTEFGFCVYRDHQAISIQEMPERAPAGQLPRSVDVFLDDDLVDKVKPGDRVQLVGLYRTLGNRNNSQTSATFRSIVLANNISIFVGKAGGAITQPVITEEDIRSIRKIAKRKNVFEMMSQSIAPSIFGHEDIKKAVLLQLMGGVEKNLPNGTHLRGDINVLMVGDPSTAKSQILRFVFNIAPLAIATTGRGASGVGLTAAVTSDKETGERRLEAGAMVLADRGVVCIDEFDKMNEIDRVAIHEVMEQQTVTIAKAGIHTSLNARCSVIAAANPVWGQYDQSKSPAYNLAMPDSLISRFDLVFIVKDKMEETIDRMISEHVLRMHRYIPPGLEPGEPIHEAISTVDLGGGEEESRETSIYEQNNIVADTRHSRSKNILSVPFLKKYIHYAKNICKPKLTSSAQAYIVDAYTNLRNDKLEEKQRTTAPITARTLETLVRLATAHAKVRLSDQVEEKDVRAVHEILLSSIFEEVKPPTKRRKRNAVNQHDGSSGDEDEEDEDESDLMDNRRSNRHRGQKNGVSSINDGHSSLPQQGRTGHSEMLASQVSSEGGISMLMGTSQSHGDDMEIEGRNGEAQRLKFFQDRVNYLRNTQQFGDEDNSSCPFEVLLERINWDLPQSDLFTISEARAHLQHMSDVNQLMISGDVVYLV
ncbi:uncharacterized protein VTP21DRAFT_5634 [Calcarisporiella thermophila]|uniref:uncharacterized protein n=1 Tax=Calcarisporiella thermophila TaxID=911321 RepID=UPI0037420516